MDFAYQGKPPPTQLATMAVHTQPLQGDQPWLADSGANSHITYDLANLTLQQPYQGTEIVAVGKEASLPIVNIGSTFVHAQSSSFHLNNILYCPSASVNLLSIQQFCQDNDCHFILNSSSYCVKDNQMGKILLQGPSDASLYPI